MAQRDNLLIVRFAFHTAVPRQIVGMAVAIVLAVRHIVLVVVADEIAQRVAVMRADEMDGRGWRATARLECLARSGHDTRDRRQLSGIPAPEGAHHIAEMVVPFGPAGRKAADAIAALAQVPRFRDQFYARQNRVLRDRPQEGGAVGEIVDVARERRGEIEAEAVDMIGFDPVPQTVEHHLQHARMREIERVAAAGAIPVEARVSRHRLVIDGVVYAAERNGRPEMIGLHRMVVDDIQNHLDAGRMQRRDGGAQTLRSTRARIARLRREIGERRIAPVVAQVLLGEEAIVGERVDRQQFDRRHADLEKMLDDRRVAERLVGAADRDRQVRAQLRQAFDMGLIDERVAPRPTQRRIVAPGPGRVLDLAFWHARRTVAPVHREVAAMRAEPVAVEGFVPADAADDLPRIRIDQELMRIEAVAVLRLIRAVHPVAVELARTGIRQIAVKDMIGTARQPDAVRLAASGGIVEAEVDLCRVLGEQGEIHPASVPRRPQRKRRTFIDPHARPSEVRTGSYARTQYSARRTPA